MEDIKIAIADDNRYFADALSDSLSRKGFKVKAVVYTISDLVSLCHYSKFEVLLLDINFNGEDALEVVPEILEVQPELKIISLTTLNNNFTKQKAFEKGILQFLSKDGDLAKLPKAIISVTEKKPVKLKISKTVEINNIKISTKKIEILKALYRYTHLEDSQIAEKLHISINTLKTHKKQLFELTHTNNTSDLLKFGIKNGLVLP